METKLKEMRLPWQLILPGYASFVRNTFEAQSGGVESFILDPLYAA